MGTGINCDQRMHHLYGDCPECAQSELDIEECAHCGKLIIGTDETNLCSRCNELENKWLAFDNDETGEERESVDHTQTWQGYNELLRNEFGINRQQVIEERSQRMKKMRRERKQAA